MSSIISICLTAFLIELNFVFTYSQITSDFVRLGEYDTDAIENDKRVDIDIDHVGTHENYNNATKINDIAIVYLVQDVEFTGSL